MSLQASSQRKSKKRKASRQARVWSAVVTNLVDRFVTV